MAADYLYGAFVVINTQTGQLLANQTGSLEDKDGNPASIYDLSGTPIIGLTTSDVGVCPPFRADVSDAVPVFGPVKLPQRSTEQFILESDLVAAKNQAVAAQSAAEDAASASVTAQGNAAAAAQAAQDAAALVDSVAGDAIEVFLDQDGGVYERLDALEGGGGGGGYGGKVDYARHDGSSWPARPTDDPNVMVFWVGPLPAPATVSSGTAGPYAGDVIMAM